MTSSQGHPFHWIQRSYFRLVQELSEINIWRSPEGKVKSAKLKPPSPQKLSSSVTAAPHPLVPKLDWGGFGIFFWLKGIINYLITVW